MIHVKNDNLNPYFNLALEEYLFKEFSEDCFLIWQNAPSVVIGKHQNAIREVNLDFTEENNITIARRLSGGGTVYHDEGNVNFTFIMTREADKVVDFKRYMKPVFEALKSLGLPVEFSERNDLFIHGKKVSGNAEHAVKTRVLHHGTLLFSSELIKLSSSIKQKKLLIIDKAVQSVRSEVTNIKDYLHKELTVQQFMDHIKKYVSKYFQHPKEYVLSSEDVKRVKALAKEKYETWEWNFGYSPRYQLIHKFDLDGAAGQIVLQVKKGIIEEVTVSGLKKELEERLSESLIGLPHRSTEILEKLNILRETGDLDYATYEQLRTNLI